MDSLVNVSLVNVTGGEVISGRVGVRVGDFVVAQDDA